MRPRTGLSRQILIAMSAITVMAGLLVFFGSYLTYSVIIALYPAPEDLDSWLTVTDLVILGCVILPALAIAAFVSLRLSRRILAPLESLARSAREITAGDLSSRASAGDKALGETAALIGDFNTMAQRLQDMAAEMALWNATIAHELRTPLTILKGRLQGMIDGVFEPDEKSLQGLIQQVDGLARLVEDLRTVTLAGSGHLDLQIEPVHLAQEIASVANLVAHDFRAAGFRLELALEDLVAAVDATRIRQALLALLTNARRHAVRGRVAVSLAGVDDRIVLSVADEGPGLPPDIVARGFVPFVRGDPVRSRELGGSGLGLSVVRAIVEAHGGRLSYRTGPDGGALFEMVLLKKKPSAASDGP